MRLHTESLSLNLMLAASMLAASFLATSADALTFTYNPELEEVVTVSPLAFRGRVTNIAYHGVDAGSRFFPYTEIQFEAGACFAGCRAGETVTLRQMGGRSPEQPDLVAHVPGLPSYVDGMEYVVFANDAMHPLFGASWGEQGVFPVLEDAGERLIVNHHGRAFGVAEDGRLIPSAERCEQLDRMSRSCAFWSEGDASELDADGHDAGHYAGKASSHTERVTLDVFEGHVRDLIVLRGKMAGPAQTVTAERIGFEAALSAFLAIGQ